MKSLSLTRPVLMLVIGLPGAGKSFFARQFAETFSAPLVSIDRLRFALFEKPTFKPDEQKLLRDVLHDQLAELLKTHSSVIIDGLGCSRVERQKIVQQASAQNYTILIVWVQTDEVTSKTRSMHRNPKRADDALNTSLSLAQFTSLTKQFVPPTSADNYVVISGKHAFSTQAKMVLRKISAPRAKAASQAYQQEATQVRRTPIKRAVRSLRNVIIR